MSYCSRITDGGLHSVSQLRYLTHLEIRACKLVTSVGLSYIAAGCKRLVELDVKSCTSIDDAGLSSIAAGCRNLRQVHLALDLSLGLGFLLLLSWSQHVVVP